MSTNVVLNSAALNPDLYCVFGHPIAHSKSPAIHAAFAAQTKQNLHYVAQLVALDGFAQALHDFAAAGGRGANVTLPFKEEAYQFCQQRTARAELAGAVNTLVFSDQAVLGDNTDGAGLLRDITHNLACSVSGKRVLILGAGGAARGVIGPLLEAQIAHLHVTNRSVDKALKLAAYFSAQAASDVLTASSYEDLQGQSFDVVINATSASLTGALPPLPEGVFASNALAYDMMYARSDTPFMAFARANGVAQCADGLGMLVEQAAEAFYVWRGVRPQTAPVLAALRAQ